MSLAVCLFFLWLSFATKVLFFVTVDFPHTFNDPYDLAIAYFFTIPAALVSGGFVIGGIFAPSSLKEFSKNIDSSFDS